MSYRSLADCVRDPESTRQLVVVDREVDPYLEVAAIQRRVYQAGGPALLFPRAKGTAFPLLGNLFGTLGRARYLFRDTLESVRRLVELKVNPGVLGKNPWRYRGVPRTLWRLMPRQVRSGPILAHQTTISRLPQIQCWPMDGGPFITLPQVYTEDPDRPGPARSNLGMYRIQLAGNDYVPDREVGLHYQIHRGIGVHHAAAIRRSQPLEVNVSVGGPPALALASVMPLPEGLPELAFAGALGGRRVRLVAPNSFLPMPADADFVICGSIDPAERKPEGPFGDHLGYYSLRHDFPVLRVERVFHREGAIWPFTSVGRPPQEDTTFGADPRADGTDHSHRDPGGPCGPRGRRSGSSPVAFGHRQRAVRALCGNPPAAGDPHACQCDPRPGPALAGEIPLDRGSGRPARRSMFTTFRASSPTC